MADEGSAHVGAPDVGPARRSWQPAPDLLVCVAVAVLAAVLAWTGAPVVVLRAVAVPTVLVVPGHAVIRVLRADDRVGPGGRALLAVATSTCCAGLGGLVLAETVGVGARAWTLSLAALTVLAAVADTVARALVGRRRRSAGTTADLSPGAGRLTTGLLVLVGGAAVLGVGEFAAQAALPAEQVSFVQLSALPGRAGTSSVTVQVTNPGDSVRTVGLEVRAGGPPIRRDLRLGPAESWSAVFTVSGSATSVRASLTGVPAQPATRVDVTPPPRPSSRPVPTRTATPVPKPTATPTPVPTPTPTPTGPLLTVAPVTPPAGPLLTVLPEVPPTGQVR